MSEQYELGDPEPLDATEALDPDEIGDDPAGDLEYPPGRFQGVNQYGVTPGEERTDEPLDERISRETPEPLLEEMELAEREDRDGRRTSSRDVADAPIGRLIDDGDDFDALAVEDQPDLSPEEAAVHAAQPDEGPRR